MLPSLGKHFLNRPSPGRPVRVHAVGDDVSDAERESIVAEWQEFRLTFSRQMFVVAYPRETQEMVFDAHNRAFAVFGGGPRRMVYDNLKAVVETISTG